MYQSLALAPGPGQAACADAGAFLRAPGAGPPVFVPPARAPAAPPYLPPREPGPQPAAHPGWAHAASADASAFGSGSAHPPAAPPAGAAAFCPHSPPGPGGARGGDGGAYRGALLAREQYQAALGGRPYPTAYPAYVSSEAAPSWASAPFEGGGLHSLQGRQAGLPGRRATLGECGAGAAPLGPGREGVQPAPTKCRAFLARWHPRGQASTRDMRPPPQPHPPRDESPVSRILTR